MGRTPLNLNTKRGQPTGLPKLSDIDKAVYNLITSKQGTGILVADLKRELKQQDAIVKRSLKTLEAQKLIKGVSDVHNKLHKFYMAVEYEPSKEITGGSWYAEGKLDSIFINQLKAIVLKYVEKDGVVTVEGLFDSLRRAGIINVDISSDQVLEILRALVLDNEIQELRSTGKGEFSSIPLEKVCYRRMVKRVSPTGYLPSVPCGVCPRISECTIGGIISPRSCEYFKKWLDF